MQGKGCARKKMYKEKDVRGKRCARKNMCKEKDVLEEKDVQGKRCTRKKMRNEKGEQDKGYARKRKWMCKENPKLENPKLKVCRGLGAMAVRGEGS